MKFESISTNSVCHPDTNDILHQKWTYFEVSFFKNPEVSTSAKPKFLLIKIKA